METILQTWRRDAGVAGVDRRCARRARVVAIRRLALAPGGCRHPLGLALYAPDHPADKPRIAGDGPGKCRSAHPRADRKMGTVARRPYGDGRDYNDSIFLGRAANVRAALVIDGLCCQAPLRYICQVNTRIGVEAMARKAQDYDDIPGTFVFDAERSR